MTADTRIDPVHVGGELVQAEGFLDYLRETIVMKSRGLSEDDAHRAVLPSKLMTVAGLLAHLRWVEAYWFRTVLSGEPNRAPYSKERPDGEFEDAATVPTAQLIAEYEAECANSRAVTARMALTDTVPFRGSGEINVRWVVLHMIEETGRHAGHLDIIRELLDGVTGE
ncbi:DinB family protein [Actinokineospora sp. NPDC004072]